MSTGRWRNNYVDAQGVNIPSVQAGSVVYVSGVGHRVSGTGTELNPFGITNSAVVGDGKRGILASGYIAYVSAGTSYSGSQFCTVTGAGMYNTVVGVFQYNNATGPSGQLGNTTYIKDFTVNEVKPGAGAVNLRVINCIINTKIPLAIYSINRCIFSVTPSYATTSASVNNVFIGLSDFKLLANICNLSIIENCEISLSKTDIETTFKNNYQAFSNCKFKIVNESTYTALTGTTEAQLRASFVARCEAQGITVPTFTEYGETNLKMGRWVFSNVSVRDGLVITGSEVAVFADKRGIYFGYNPKTVSNLPITTGSNVPNSFAPVNPKNGNITIDSAGIRLSSNFDPTTPQSAYTWSKPMWLGEMKDLTNLFLSNNLNQKVGVNVDSSPNLKQSIAVIAGNNLLSDGINYVVRSSDNNFASFQIGTQVYSTDLNGRFNIIRGQATAINVTNIIGKPVLYEVSDFSTNQTIPMRIVSQIPTPQIISGNLQAGYWYMVEPTSPNDLTGTVTYNSVVHPVYDAFLVSTPLIFAIQGACHLRRMWRQDYTESSEVTDSVFWANRQKPKKFDILINDMRCLMKNNSASEVEMQSDANGNYIASGHPDFYDKISGRTGLLLPAFPVQGVFVQIGIEITSLNNM